MDPRRQQLLEGLQPSSQLGLELGPMDRPMVTRSMGKVIYVDRRSQEDLRKVWKAESQFDLNQLQVDAVWHEKPLKEAIGVGLLVDYVVASHVVEHCSDLIGWLGQIADVLRPDGSLRLAVPDKRYIFDVLREPTGAAAVIAAHLRGSKNPDENCTLDFFLHQAEWGGATAWQNPDHLAAKPMRSTKEAFSVAQKWLASADDLDCHCWTFTPFSFAGLMKTLAELELVRYACGFHKTTQPMSNEFFVSMVPCADPARAAASWQNMRSQEEEGELLFASRRILAKLRALKAQKSLQARGTGVVAQNFC